MTFVRRVGCWNIHNDTLKHNGDLRTTNLHFLVKIGGGDYRKHMKDKKVSSKYREEITSGLHCSSITSMRG